ncbi:condensation domain-containing protein, partial [Chryseobacterium sp. JM1]|uniref:condensation domain-containing protein n=1 Tax=Chryseobacterium sp. JM1 TaxID=1233950 RepID=UPI0004E77D71
NIPLTSNGKIDRRSLPAVSSEDLIQAEYIAAQTAEEKALVEVCEQVLKHSPISLRDNYYNLGGDSIKSIQIVSRLRQRGYHLKVEHILQYPVLEELSRYITTDFVVIDQAVITGSANLTPIQRYFFESGEIVNKNHYNQSVILKSSERLSGNVLESSIKTLVSHHDALRMVYREEFGLWSQYNQGIEESHYRLEYFDLRDSGSESEELLRLQEIGENLQSSINIESGILFHIGHVSMSDGDRLLLIIHHLVVDGVSWRILLEDLGTLYESGIKKETYALPSKTDSFQSWGHALEQYSSSSALSKELVYWKKKHGREVLTTGLDISRTVGWFTSVYPFSLDISDISQPALVSVKESLRNIPHKGIGYGILKYLGQGLSSAERPSVQFNYLGDFDDATGSTFQYTTENMGDPVSKDNQRTDILLDVSGMTVNGEMTINFRYSDKVFDSEISGSGTFLSRTSFNPVQLPG